MLCEKAGIGQQTIENMAAYIQDWRDTIKADRGVLLQASHAAEKALEFIAPQSDDSAAPAPNPAG